METIKEIKLSYEDYYSDKVYYIFISKIDSSHGDYYKVHAKYGKRYNANMTSNISKRPVSRSEAEHFYQKTLKQKLNKGYEIMYEEEYTTT